MPTCIRGSTRGGTVAHCLHDVYLSRRAGKLCRWQSKIESEAGGYSTP
jgi:hypothetical protein